MDINDYLALIPPPNSIQPNFMAWFEANAEIAVEIQECLNSFDSAFFVDTAEGVQLDIIGELVGLSREVDFDPGGGASSILPDSLYRIALKAKILKNNWDGTKEQIYDFWAIWLPEYPVLIMDNEDMTMSVLVVGMPNDLTGTYIFAFGPEGGDGPLGSILAGWGTGYWEGYVGILRGLVSNGYFTPKPAGVSVDYAFQDTPAFAFGFDTDYLKGWGDGEWVSFS